MYSIVPVEIIAQDGMTSLDSSQGEKNHCQIRCNMFIPEGNYNRRKYNLSSRH